MIYNGEEVDFPAVMQVSFFKLIQAMEEMVGGPDEVMAHCASELLKEVDRLPELRDGLDINKLDDYKPAIDRMSSLLFPQALMTNEIKALTPPFYFKPIYTSTRFDNIVEASGKDFEYEMKGVDKDLFYLYCCYFIMGSYYGYPLAGGGPLTVEIFNKHQGLMRTYKMLVNADMMEFIPTEKALEITQEDYEELLDNFHDIELWKQKFPPNSWIMRGVNLINMMDVTIDQSLSSISSTLLAKSDDGFEHIQTSIRNLLNNVELDIGALRYDRGQISIPRDKDVRSLLFGAELEAMDCESGMCESSYDLVVNQRKPLVISDVKRYHKRVNSKMSAFLESKNFESFILAPLVHDDELLGFLEIGAYKRYDLSSAVLGKLDVVLPILATAISRFVIEEENEIEAIIQQECTTIHPSVKWRFQEEAEKFLYARERNEHPVYEDIVFQKVYPLFGQTDIRNSSNIRNSGVVADLVKQIGGVKKVLKQAYEDQPMPIYKELLHRLDNFKGGLKDGLSAGSEHQILTFLKSEVYPIFKHLENGSSKAKQLLKAYHNTLDPQLNMIYEERKVYDDSVNLINQRLAAYLDKKQEEAQRMFPHYFERYKTDGVEYNMYIGQSIARDKEFDPIYLKNLRLWQLMTMCELENEFKATQKELTIPIEVASLVLVYNTALSIHFRMDEKQFDVEGAYNARYEIIKKRIDKANIRGTQERVTQPSYLTIIYSQESDAKEYREYIDFLSAKGMVVGELEDHDLEDLQGISGLRALRVKVAYSGELTVDDIIQEVESGQAE